MALEPITRQEQLLNAVATGETVNIKPITREEMFLAKAGGQDVKTPNPITRKEMFLNKIAENGGGNSGGGSVTPSGNFKKKFMSFMRVKKQGTFKYDFVATFGSAMLEGSGGVAYDEEVLPTKTSDGVKVTTNSEIHLYFIEDENNVFVYGDIFGTGTAEWVSINALGAEFGGVLTDPNQTTPNVVYVLFYYVEAEGE